jgi:cytochrome oxidase assembly protein ShyY1
MTATLRPYWRRMIVPGLFTIVSLAILISLGVWQLQRKAWKEGLIATLDAQMKAAPAPLPPPLQWPTLTQENSEFRRVSARVSFVPNAPPVYIYTGASALRADVKQPGYFVFAPAQLPGGQTIVINRGYVGMDRKHEEPPANTEVVGYIRWPEKQGFFVPDHGTDDIRFVRDPAAMAKAFRWGPVAPFYIDQEAPVPASGMPRPGSLSVKLRNDHLGYALTWFGLAGALAGVFVIWAAKERYPKTS